MNIYTILRAAVPSLLILANLAFVVRPAVGQEPTMSGKGACTRVKHPASDDYDGLMELCNQVTSLKKEARYGEALEAAGRLIARYPKSFLGHEYKGDCLYGLARYPEAMVAYDKAIELSPDLSNAYHSRLKTIERLHESGNEDRTYYYGKSLGYYNALIEKSPDDITLKLYKWDTLRRMGRKEEAQKQLRGLLEKAPMAAIKFMVRQGLNEEALEAANEAITLDPKSYSIYYEKATLLEDLNRHQEALNALDKAIEFNPGFDGYNAKAACIKETDRYIETVEGNDETMAEWDVAAWSAYDMKGFLLFKARRYEEAVKAFHMADIAGRGGSEDTRVFLAFALQKCGGEENMKRAEELLSPIAESNMELTKIRVLSLLGRKQEMLARISELVNENPGCRNLFMTAPEFEAWWNDPDFIAIVGSDELPDKAEQAAPVTEPYPSHTTP